MNTQEKLAYLHNLQQSLLSLTNSYQLTQDEIMELVKPELDRLSKKFQPQFDQYNQVIQELTDEIKSDVINQGKTIKSSNLMAVYSKPRISWDTKGLDGYMVAHPEIVAFRNEGKASVSIRVIK